MRRSKRGLKEWFLRRHRRELGGSIIPPAPPSVGLFLIDGYWTWRDGNVSTPDGYMVETSPGEFATRTGIFSGLNLRVDATPVTVPGPVLVIEVP